MPPRSSTDDQNNGSTTPLKPWSSGRVLSAAQRERKRLMNRASQSRRRNNLKNTLKTVESRLFQIERRCLAYLPPPTSGEYTFDDCISANSTGGADDCSTSLRDFLNDLLGSIFQINPGQVCTNEQFNQDAVIRGVVLGWDVLRKQDFVCPIWNILRRVDALLMMHASVPARLALLRGIHMMLLVCIFAGAFYGRRLSDRPPPLPPWFRPSSESIVNDYFAWPRFRQKLITSNNPPLTNRFWFYFTRNVQFECDLSPAHTIDIDPDTGKYRLTTVFRDVTDDIHRYTMGSEFFEAYPECFEDVYACALEDG
uniref:Protein virilizer n=1 Tax=Talaromyces marneffei PM1 TaxID=1077442 RepID=A0A093VHA6_TALMA